jgi:peptidoglycan/xylan/chitin deacetylase (PgdA/CDA1 family)
MGPAGDADRLALCYHGISERWPEHFSVSPASLDDQIAHLLRRGYEGVTFSELAAASPDARRFAVTFDDGYASVRERALPVLAKHDVPGTAFVCPGLVGSEALALTVHDWRETSYRDELAAMGWDDLRALLAEGWEIGSHTVSHAKLTELEPPALEAELGESRAELERRLGIACQSLAYPYGAFDPRVAAGAAAAGYEWAATLVPGLAADPAPLAWPRVGIAGNLGSRAFRVKVSRPMRAARSTSTGAAAIEPLRRLRRRLGA